MELAIPLVALGGLYMASQTNKKENFVSNNALPNTDIPNRNYDLDVEEIVPELDQTSKLSTVNKFDAPTVYTDKYFKGDDIMPNTAAKESFTSLTGQAVDANYFKHNNMTPFFGAKNRSTILESDSNEGILDNYSGSGTQFINKSEQTPLFKPEDNYQYAHGAPNKNDFYQSRVNASWRMANEKPFESKMVGPGLGLGATEEGSGGFNSGMTMRDQWMPKQVDDLRTANNPRAGGIGLIGHEGPAHSAVQNLGSIGKMEKNRVERTWEMGPERYFTTTGVEKGHTLHAIPIDRHVHRPETSASYTGNATSKIPETYKAGEYMESKHMDLGEVPLGVASAVGTQGATSGDYERKSQHAYTNNRSVGTQNTYFGALGSALGAVVAPLLDELRPSRKENTLGTLRPYQNAHTSVSSSYLFNPGDRPGTTIRETTEKNKYVPGINTNQHGGAYLSTSVQNTPQERDTTNRFYAGNSSAGAGTKNIRPYDAEYNQRNNDIKSSTIKGHMVQGNMKIPNHYMNVRNKNGELVNKRPSSVSAGPRESANLAQMGDVHTRQQYNSNVQLDRNSPEILSAFKENPFTHSLTNVP